MLTLTACLGTAAWKSVKGGRGPLIHPQCGIRGDSYPLLVLKSLLPPPEGIHDDLCAQLRRK
jgi:hypothetical protein